MKKQFLTSLELKKDITEYSEEYPFNLDAVKNLKHINFHENVTFIVGENGSGKSTILEALAVNMGFNPEGGSKNFNFYTEKTHSELYDAFRIAKGVIRAKDGYFLRAESFYNVASNIDNLDRDPSFGPPIINSYGGVSLHKQSHGESFFSLFRERLGGNGLYIFDEPEAALSPQRQLALLVRLNELVKQNSQFIIATHSPILLAYPNAKIIEISKNGYHEVSLQESETYSVYHSFFENPEKMIDKLGIEKHD